MKYSGRACLLASFAVVMPQAAMAGDRGDDTAPIQADDGADVAADGIVVTARKRAESLQDVPVAVIALSQEKLQNGLATDLTKVAELAPQVSIGRSVAGTGAVLTIRGISSAAEDSGLDQSVSMSIDGVAMSRGRIIQTATFDMKQVEILQGPQALFFGKNSPAGVISIRSADPTDRMEGYVRAGFEFNAKEKYAEAAISGPLAETVQARLAGRFSHMLGWIRNVSQPGPNPFQPFAPLPGPVNGDIGPKGHDAATRLTIRWEPSDTFNATLKGTFASQRVNSNAAYQEPFCTGGTTTVPVTLGVVQPNADCAINRRKSESALPAALAINYPYGNNGVPYLRSDMGLASLDLEKTLGNITVSSVTGYYNQLHRGASDADFSALVQIYDAERERFEMINQELRISSDFSGPANFMAGAYFERSNRHWLNAPAVLYFLNPVTNNYATAVAQSDSRTTSYSFFGQLNFKLVENLELAAGARYSHDRKSSSIVNLANNPAAALLGISLYPENVPIRSRYSGDNLSPEVTLTWTPLPTQTLYAAYKTGYKAGGISNPALLDASFTSQSLLFKPEKAKGFEIGYKAEFLDRRLRLDLVGYRYNYDGLQVTAYNSQAIRFSITNAASSRTSGVSGSFDFAVTDDFSLNGNVGYNRARYQRFTNAPCYAGQTAAAGCVNGTQDLSGKALNRAPEVNFTLGAEYDMNIGNWATQLSASATYSSSYQTATDYSPGGVQPSYWRINAAIRTQPGDSGFQFALIGRNLTNAYYKTSTYTQSLGNFDQYTAFFSRPREVAIQLSRSF